MKRWFWTLDALVVISFVVIGADTHGFTYGIAEILRVAVPFLIVLGGGIIALRAWKRPLSLPNGFLLGATTLGGGMLLRQYVWSDGTARTFVLVSGAYFVALMVGWRLVVHAIVWLRNRTWSADAIT